MGDCAASAWQEMATFPDGQNRRVLVFTGKLGFPWYDVVDCDNRVGDEWFNGDVYVKPEKWAEIIDPDA